ncbi:MAG: hypothetical protein HXY28_03105 [Hydrogenophilaceae bacterium]|jgi:hypothetical protein|nr:hypothetical protein [Hydrogenophilaceae bacterium]
MRFFFRWWVFYPALLIAAGAIILASLGPAVLRHEARPVAGAVEDGALVLAGDALSHAEASPETVFYVARNAGWRVTGLRVAVLPGNGPVKPEERGLRVLLAGDMAQALGSGPFRVDVEVAPVPVTTAPFLALGLDRGGTIEWLTQPVSVVESVISYTFAASASGALQAIALRPVATLEDYNYGVEIRSIRIVPIAGAGAS